MISQFFSYAIMIACLKCDFPTVMLTQIHHKKDLKNIQNSKTKNCFSFKKRNKELVDFLREK